MNCVNIHRGFLRKDYIPEVALISGHKNVRQFHDKEGFEKFRQMAGPTIAEYGGKVLVREPNPDVREGKISGIALVIEFYTIFYEISYLLYIFVTKRS